MTFTLIQKKELPNGTILLTLASTPTDHGGLPLTWTVVVTTDGVSDQVINPQGEIITPGPVDGKIPHELWGKCAEILV